MNTIPWKVIVDIGEKQNQVTKYMRPKFKKLSCSRMELLLLGKFYPYQTINIVKNVTKLVK